MGRPNVFSLAYRGVCTAVCALLAAAGVADEALFRPPEQGMTLLLPQGQDRVVQRLFIRNGGQPAQKTAVALRWDAQGLSAIFDCHDTAVHAQAGRPRDDAGIGQDDGVALLLDHGHRHQVPIHIRLSAAGALADGRGCDGTLNVTGLEAKAERTAAGWRGTLRIPWPGLGGKAPAPGDVWGLGLQRIDAGADEGTNVAAVSSSVPFSDDSAGVRNPGHLAFVRPEMLEDDASLAAVRTAVKAAHGRAMMQWAMPNETDRIALASNAPAMVPALPAIRSGAPERQGTRVTLSPHPVGLAVRFDCDDTAVFAGQTGRDNVKLWKDDSVYLYLDPGHTHGTGTVMVQVSAAGVVFDAKDGDAAWNAEGLSVTAVRSANGWSAQLALPWRALGVDAPAAGAVLGVNLARMDQPGKTDFGTMELSALALESQGNAGAVDGWGHLVFGAAGSLPPSANAVHAARQGEITKRFAAEAARVAAEQEALAKGRGIPANPRASAEARQVLRLITDLPQRKDQRVFLAQHLEWMDAQASYERNVADLAKSTGKHVGMIELSYQDPVDPRTSRAHFAHINQAAIRFWKEGHLVGFHWNPNNPWTGGLYDDLRGRGQLAEILVPGKPANVEWMKKLDALAALFGELREAGVVVLWRPLHEMTFIQGYWYDAGATPDPEVYKNIWRHMFRYLTETKGLDNLLWVYSAANVGVWNGPSPKSMYPGGEYVDIVGLSLYDDESEIFGGAYEELTALGKPFALSEFGPGTMLGEGAGQFDNLGLVRAIRERYPLATYANYWCNGDNAKLAIFSLRNAAELLNHPLILDRAGLNWRGDAAVGIAAQGKPAAGKD